MGHKWIPWAQSDAKQLLRRRAGPCVGRRAQEAGEGQLRSAVARPEPAKRAGRAALSALGAQHLRRAAGVMAGPQNHRRWVGAVYGSTPSRELDQAWCCSAPSCPAAVSATLFGLLPPCGAETAPTVASAAPKLPQGVVRARRSPVPWPPSSHHTVHTPPHSHQPLLGPTRHHAANSTRATDLGGDPT